MDWYFKYFSIFSLITFSCFQTFFQEWTFLATILHNWPRHFIQARSTLVSPPNNMMSFGGAGGEERGAGRATNNGHRGDGGNNPPPPPPGFQNLDPFLLFLIKIVLVPMFLLQETGTKPSSQDSRGGGGAQVCFTIINGILVQIINCFRVQVSHLRRPPPPIPRRTLK